MTPRRAVRARAWAGAGLALLVLLGGAGALVWALNVQGEEPVDAALPAGPADPQQAARGAYLARAGNCIGCHTARGGTPYAGGRAIETPFGSVYSTNLTPDPATGLAAWSAAQFWRALHHGRSRDGRLLVPAFPYPNYTRVTRADSDAIHAYLRSLAPVVQPTPPHALRFPYDSQLALALWRALYFRPASPQPAPPDESGAAAERRRGAYLVQGLGHCSACHAHRNALGASLDPLDLGGGLIPMQHWYAPSLAAPSEAGVQDWEPDQIVALLGTGSTPKASVAGPMAEVVRDSTQHLTQADLRAMAAYLKALPVRAPAAAPTGPTAGAADPATGARVYERECAACHGERGAGVAGIYPALAGNRAVTLASPVNAIRVVLEGGYAPSTAGNPRPYGMPPFATVLTNHEVAAVVTHMRSSWGNQAPAADSLEVERLRGER